MKYYRTFLMGLESELLSWPNLIGWFFVGLIPTSALVLVWFTILGDKANIGGFTKGDFIIYYLFTLVGWYIVGGTFGWRLGNDIKNGAVTTSLLKSYNIVIGKASEEQAWKLMSLIVTLPITIIILFLFRDIINISLSGEQILALIISLFLGALIYAISEGILGLSAFWFVEIWPFVLLKEMTLFLFGGLMVPLVLMPAPILFLANLLPFKYMFYVPVSILLNKTQSPLNDIAIQILYILLLYLLYKIIWIFGIKKYESVGS